MKIPAPPYVAVYGSHVDKGPKKQWRNRVFKQLRAAKIQGFDPTDPCWNDIESLPDAEQQARASLLVKQQHRALRGADCAILYLIGSKASHAARAEIAFATGRGIRSFVVIEPKAKGRHYLIGMMKLYPHMTLCPSLEEATSAAIEHLTNVS